MNKIINGRYVDLHVHTTYSDGSFTPEEVIRYAKQMGLCAISITDHDITDGIPYAIAEGEKLGIEVIPGIELSAEFSDKSIGELHILGYYINWQNAEFQERLLFFREARQKRAVLILEKLAKAGVLLDQEELKELAGPGTIGRLHVARVMVQNGFVNTIYEAFQRFLANGKPAYVPKVALSPEDAIKLLLNVGGIPVLAHPYYGQYNNRELINTLVEYGMKGIEVWHSKHSPTVVRHFAQVADELHLLSTGGSDCHGRFGTAEPMMGTIRIAYDSVQHMKILKQKMDAAFRKSNPIV